MGVTQCSYGLEMVVIGKCEMSSTDISQEIDYAILMVKPQLQLQINSSVPTLPTILNLFYRNIIGTYWYIIGIL